MQLHLTAVTDNRVPFRQATLQQLSLAALLGRLAIVRVPLFVTGDFNIRPDRDVHHADQLRSLLDAFGLIVGTVLRGQPVVSAASSTSSLLLMTCHCPSTMSTVSITHCCAGQSSMTHQPLLQLQFICVYGGNWKLTRFGHG